MVKVIKNKQYVLYTVLVMLVFVSFAVTNISYDAEYQMAMAYRFMQGDAMITQMWEPHQTSAFLNAILMKLYLMITGTTTGIVLYMQVVGLCIRGGIAYLIYKGIRVFTNPRVGAIASLLYFVISPKELSLPEFGNMQLWSATLLFIMLIGYFESQKCKYLVMSALSFCFGVFSYPSFLVLYPIVVFLFCCYSKQKYKSIIIFTATGGVIGISFVLYLLSYMDIEVLLNCVEHALALEPTHTVHTGEKIISLLKGMSVWVLQITIVAACTYLGMYTYKMVRVRKLISRNHVDKVCFWIVYWYVMQVFLLFNILSVENRGNYIFPCILMLIQGFVKRKLLNIEESRFYMVALWISMGCLVSTLILSDNAFLQAIPYMLLAICASVLPLYRWYQTCSGDVRKQKYLRIGMHIFLLLLIFRALFIHIPISGRGQIMSVLDDMALIRSGPGIGIISNEQGVAVQRDTMLEWGEYVEAGDKVWVIGEPVDTLAYMYENVEVAAPTVMSTPTYNEHLLYYWELNPDKYPEVIAVSAYMGELAWEVRSNDWLMNFLEVQYQAEKVVDGVYWKYYIKK